MELAPAPNVRIITAAEASSQRPYTTINMLLRMPGTEAVKYTVPARDSFTLLQVNPVYGKLASAVLKDTIDGAKILFESEGELPHPPDSGFGNEPWWERRIHMIKAIANLPGVHDYKFVGRSAVAIHAINEEARAGLLNVLRTHLPDKFMTKIYVVVSKTGPEPNDN